MKTSSIPRLLLLSLVVVTLCFTAVAQRRRPPANPTQTETEATTTNWPAPRYRTYGPEIIIPELGIKVIDIDYPIENERQRQSREELCARLRAQSSPSCALQIKRLPRVIAVQERGPAFLAGVVPGDVVAAFGQVNWQPSSYLREFVAREARSSINFNVYLYYNVNNSPYPETELMLIPYGAPTQGSWITDIVLQTSKKRSKLPGAEAARNETRAKAKEEYDRAYNESIETILSRPCQISIDEHHAMTRRLDQLANAANIGNSSGDLLLAEDTACVNFKEGQLTNTEVAVWAMMKKYADPCTYNPTTDYRSMIDKRTRLLFLSKRNYEYATVSVFQSYLEKASPDQRRCFLEILRSSLVRK